MKVLLMILSSAILLASTTLYAQSQRVEITVKASSDNSSYRATVSYQPTDNQQTTGLGIQVHYSTSLIDVDDPVNILEGITGLQKQDDTDNKDDNSATDRYFNAAWFEINGNWPEAVSDSTVLFEFDFTLKNADERVRVPFNVTPVSVATGYDFQPVNYSEILGRSDGSSDDDNGGGETVASENIQSAITELEEVVDVNGIKMIVSDLEQSIANVTLNDEMALDAGVFSNQALRSTMVLEGVINEGEAASSVLEKISVSPGLLRVALNMAPALGKQWLPDVDRLRTSIVEQGLAGGAATRLASALSDLTALPSIMVGAISAEDILLGILGPAAALNTHEVVGVLEISLPNESYLGAVTAVRLVGDLVPEGLRFLPDGSIVMVGNGYAFEMAPVAQDLLKFIAEVEQSNFSFDITESGTVALDLGDGASFSGAFSYTNMIGSTGSCDSLSITGPQGEPERLTHSFGVQCQGGVQQAVVPFVHNMNFFAMNSSIESVPQADRNTGIITVPETGRFRPGFFVSRLDAVDQLFLEANQNADGVAVKSSDINNDGVQDLLFYSDQGVQPIYGLVD